LRHPLRRPSVMLIAERNALVTELKNLRH